VANKIRLDIVTPEKVTYSASVNMVIARTLSGDIGILPGHASLIGALAVWPLRILTDDGEDQIAVAGGFIEVQPDKVTVLANCAELAEEIDVERAETAKERAERRLKESKEDHEMRLAEAALHRALVRLQVAKNKKPL
jgi:F-type H+-transporting ATPase subunit epsilon